MVCPFPFQPWLHTFSFICDKSLLFASIDNCDGSLLHLTYCAQWFVTLKVIAEVDWVSVNLSNICNVNLAFLFRKMTGRVIVVTGASSGLGYEVARYLCEGGNDVILACRNEEKANRAIEKIKRTNPNALATYMNVSTPYKWFFSLNSSSKTPFHWGESLIRHGIQLPYIASLE